MHLRRSFALLRRARDIHFRFVRPEIRIVLPENRLLMLAVASAASAGSQLEPHQQTFSDR